MQEALASATHTKELVVGAGALAELPDVVKRRFRAGKVALVADENTMRAAGDRAIAELVRGGVAVSRTLVFPSAPRIDAGYPHAIEVRDFLARGDEVPLAVGSGTINDLVKRAAFEVKRPYLVAATAASVDGYTSYGAALVLDGFKVSMECDAPAGVVADLDVLVGAPQEMTAAGYGDLVAKVPGGADWIIADELGIDPIVPLGWTMVQEDLRSWVRDPGAVGRREGAAVERLFGGLAVTGFSMQALRSSRPVSGAEHLLSHVWEMQHLHKDGIPVSHGFKVGIGSLGTTGLMELLLDLDPEGIDAERRAREWPDWSEREAEIRAAWAGGPQADAAVAACRKKHLSGAQLRDRIKRAQARWRGLKERVGSQLFSYGELRRMFVAAGLPVTPEQIGLSRERAVATFRLAQTIRDRYTVLDLAFELGVLDDCASRIDRSATYWR